MRIVLLAFCFLLLAAGAPQASAQVTIHRCIGPTGGPVFTDQPCAALQATPAPAPAPAARAASPDLGRAPAILCAEDGADLRRVVADAFAARDANRLANVMWWNGLGGGTVVADIRALADVLREPLLQVTTAPGPAGAPDASGEAEPSADAAPPTALDVETAGGVDGTRTLRFDVVRRAGCLWLRRAG